MRDKLDFYVVIFACQLTWLRNSQIAHKELFIFDASVGTKPTSERETYIVQVLFQVVKLPEVWWTEWGRSALGVLRHHPGLGPDGTERLLKPAGTLLLPWGLRASGSVGSIAAFLFRLLDVQSPTKNFSTSHLLLNP